MMSLKILLIALGAISLIHAAAAEDLPQENLVAEAELKGSFGFDHSDATLQDSTLAQTKAEHHAANYRRRRRWRRGRSYYRRRRSSNRRAAYLRRVAAIKRERGKKVAWHKKRMAAWRKARAARLAKCMKNKKCKARHIAHQKRMAAWRKRRAAHIKCMRNKKCKAAWLKKYKKRIAAWRKARGLVWRFRGPVRCFNRKRYRLLSLYRGHKRVNRNKWGRLLGVCKPNKTKKVWRYRGGVRCFYGKRYRLKTLYQGRVMLHHAWQRLRGHCKKTRPSYNSTGKKPAGKRTSYSSGKRSAYNSARHTVRRVYKHKVSYNSARHTVRRV